MNKQKLKILYLLKILMEETDENHKLTQAQIKDRLSGYGIEVERKAFYVDVELLIDFGVDVIKEIRGRNTCYYIGNREFELPELKLLVDLVQSSRFLTAKKSGELIKKIETLTSRHEALQLNRQVYVSGRIKAENEMIYYNVDCLHTAINADVRVRFQYFQWNRKKERQLRHDGRFYEVSPWVLLWDNQNYYLIAYDDEIKAIRHFRVDKMLHIELTEHARDGREELMQQNPDAVSVEGRGDSEQFDPVQYANRVFGMFDGELQSVRIRAVNELAGVLIDRFGSEITLEPVGEESFETVVDVVVSEQFFGWVLALGNGIRIVGPQGVVERMRRMLSERMEIYGDWN